MKPRLLDLFCGAGGAAKGYQRAGFYVVGVDHKPQPNYCGDKFVQADALEYLALHTLAKDGKTAHERYPRWVAPFDAIHASPPCQPHSSLTGWGRSRRNSAEQDDLIPETRELLKATGLPYVIENVEGAKLENAVRLCGQSMGLKVRRHRYFECSFPVMVPPCWHPEPPVIVVRGSIGRKVFDPRRKAIAPTREEAKLVMGMPWAKTNGELADAVPPAYTALIGEQLRRHLRHSQGLQQQPVPASVSVQHPKGGR